MANTEQTYAETKMDRTSVVQVYFPERNRSYAYYNDRFDLVPGDIVFVEGKLEGIRGRVTSVSYNFKINLAVYKRVIAKADITLHGEFQRLDSYIVTFDPSAAPFEKILTFFRAPDPEDVQWVRGSDGKMFPLDTLKKMEIPVNVRNAGLACYLDENVVYLCVDHGQGLAIVEGSHPYVVEFTYRDGQIGNMNCTCFGTGFCKHQYAVLLQLEETLKKLETFPSSNYFAILTKSLFTAILIEPQTGSIRLS